MLSTCPPRVTGVALAVSSCPRTRCCCVRLLLLDGPVLLLLLVLLWSSQAVRGPGVAVSASSCLTVRYCCYCWCCSGPLKLSEDQVLLCPPPLA